MASVNATDSLRTVSERSNDFKVANGVITKINKVKLAIGGNCLAT